MTTWLGIVVGLGAGLLIVGLGKLLERWMFPSVPESAVEVVPSTPPEPPPVEAVTLEIATPPDPPLWSPIVGESGFPEPLQTTVLISAAEEPVEVPSPVETSSEVVDAVETPAVREARRAARKRARRAAAKARAPKRRQPRVKAPKPAAPPRAAWRKTGTDQYQHRDGAVVFWRDGSWETWGGDAVGAIRSYSPKRLAEYLGLSSSGLPDA